MKDNTNRKFKQTAFDDRPTVVRVVILKTVL